MNKKFFVVKVKKPYYCNCLLCAGDIGWSIFGTFLVKSDNEENAKNKVKKRLPIPIAPANWDDKKKKSFEWVKKQREKEGEGFYHLMAAICEEPLKGIHKLPIDSEGHLITPEG